jgi:GAF domain-containing protein
MEPIPETVEAIEHYRPWGAVGVDLLSHLRDLSVEVTEVVPDCLGFSLASRESGVTFTLVASDLDVAVLDAVQYLAGGPCVSAVDEQRTSPVGYAHDDLLDEGSWQLFGRATAAKGVRSTLTLPLLDEGLVVGSVNLYGGSGRAFTGHHDALAAVFGAWAPGAVTNADLSFDTLREARQAPRLLREGATVQIAVGILAADEGIHPALAERRLRDAAMRADIALHELAEAVLEAHGLDGDDR